MSERMLERTQLLRKKRLRSGMLITMIAVAYTLVTSILFPLWLSNFSEPDWTNWMMYLCPFNLVYLLVFALAPPSLLWVITPLALLPAVGCVLLAGRKKPGIEMIRVPQIVQIVMFTSVMPLNVLTSVGHWSDFKEILLLGAASIVLPVVTLVGLHRWTDNIRFE